MAKYAIMALIGLISGFAGAALFSVSGLGHAQTRDYLVANPEILPQMVGAYEADLASQRLKAVAGDVNRPFAEAILGNPEGSKVLVKFTDYACGYCRTSVADIDRLIAANPDLKVVVREWPIFEGSEAAARMGLAAAKQGKYDAFYHAMFQMGPPTAQSIAAAAQAAGIDVEAARTYGASDEVTTELARTDAMARQLGFTGTPSWVMGDEVFEGAIGFDRLASLVAEAGG